MILPIIPPLDTRAEATARARQRVLTKPAGALGQLEALSIRLVAMTGRLDWLPARRAVIVCAGDHGVTAQGVSAFPSAVTQQMVLNFLRGGAAVNVLARQMGARVKVVDAGVAADFDDHPDLVRGKIAYGTADLSIGPAMTPEQTEQSLALGLSVVQSEIDTGLDIVVVGEMGIGNSTAAAAIIAVLTGSDPVHITGRGTGVDDVTLVHKQTVVARGLSMNAPAQVNTLAKLGGFEIGAMAGVMIGAAAARVPIVIDGVISTAAALIAVQLAPAVRNYLIAGHRSVEPGHIAALDTLGLDPLINLGLRLGEGTGGLLALPLIEAAMRTLQEMATFDDAGVSGPV